MTLFNRKAVLPILILLVVFVLLTGCSPLVRPAQLDTGRMIALQEGQSVGQSLLANYNGLAGVDVYLAPSEAFSPGAVLHLHLKSSPDAAADLRQAALPLDQLQSAGYTSFRFSPLGVSTHQNYFIQLDVTGSGQVDLASGPGDAYLDGSLYIDGQPDEGQLAFKIAYDPLGLALGVLQEALTWLAWMLGAGFLFVLPGWALLALSLPRWKHLIWAEKLGLSAGVGAALYPLLFLWTGALGLHLGALYAWLPGLLAGGYLAWRSRFWKLRPRGRSLLIRAWRSPAFWPDAILVLVIILVFFIRFWAIRGLDAPLWGDLVQHTAIAQLLVDHGGMFQSWQPYTPFTTMTVQYGVSTAAAVWKWLFNQDILLSMLRSGQVLNALAVLTLYPLALLITRGASPWNRWAGVVTVLAAGLLSSMPAYYLNWGRYAQLFGQVALPAALCLTWYALEGLPPVPARALLRSGALWKTLPVIAVTVGGMLLGYYRMFFNYVTFIPGLLLLLWFGGILRGSHWRERLKSLVPRLVILSGVAGFSLLLLAPWILNVLGSGLAGKVQGGITNQYSFDLVITNDYRVWLDTFVYFPRYLVYLALGALAAALIVRRWRVLILIPWFVLLALVRAATLIHLPGANMMQSFAVVTALYMPISLALGWLAAEAACWLPWLQLKIRDQAALLEKSAALLLSVGVLLAAAYGLYGQKGIGDEAVYHLVTHPDIRAMQWIEQNIPADAVFLVEGFRVYQGRYVVGSDAGWWLPIVTGRQNTIPPQYALLNEKPEQPGYVERVAQLTALLEQAPPSDPQVWPALCQWGITHIYIGQRQGIASMERIQLFLPDQMKNLPLVYAQDRVRIYQFPRQFCSPPVASGKK